MVIPTVFEGFLIGGYGFIEYFFIWWNCRKPLVDCNCRNKNTCPLDGKCLTDNIIYQASVTSQNGVEETYTGLTADKFKLRYANHKKSFTHENYSTDSTLSSYIWKLKSENINYSISWKIIDRGKPFSPIHGNCQLCTKEKYFIIFNPEISSLNSRNELGTACRHKPKLLLSNLK